MSCIIIITGTPGVGKSVVAQALAKKISRSVYLSVDTFREMVISGYVFPGQFNWTKETFLQSKIARENVCFVAKTYVNNDFTVIIDDIVVDESYEFWMKSFPHNAVKIYILTTLLSVIFRRNKERKNGKSRRITRKVIRYLNTRFEMLRSQLVHNSSFVEVKNTQSIRYAVHTILNRQ